jgi:hypothetical protein
MNPHPCQRKSTCDIIRYPGGPGGTGPHINGRVIDDFHALLNGSRPHRESELNPSEKCDAGRLETTVAPLVLCAVLVGGRVRRGAR